jgi:DNA-binding CsgD family transcriptional regulator
VEPDGSGISRALLDPLYDSATQPEVWEVFLQKASEVLRADKAAIMTHAPGNEWTAICVDLGVSEETRRDTEEMMKFSPWMMEILKHQETGWYSGSPEDVLPMEPFRKTKFYNELFRKHNIEWAAAANVFGPGGSMAGFVVSRPKTHAPFSAEDKELLRQLVPHLGRVFKVHRVVTSLRERNAASQHALDLIGAACITLDGRGLVLSKNRRAEALLADGGILRIKGRRILVALSAEQKALDACVFPACACGAGKGSDPGSGAVVLHSGKGTPVYVSVLPYHSNWALLESCPSALVFITTPEEQGHGEHRLWQAMFELSPAECRVAEMMKQGVDVADISEAIKIKVDTVRYYQKSIYRKAGVRGQSQLVRLLTRLPSASP